MPNAELKRGKISITGARAEKAANGSWRTSRIPRSPSSLTRSTVSIVLQFAGFFSDFLDVHSFIERFVI